MCIFNFQSVRKECFCICNKMKKFWYYLFIHISNLKFLGHCHLSTLILTKAIYTIFIHSRVISVFYCQNYWGEQRNNLSTNIFAQRELHLLIPNTFVIDFIVSIFVCVCLFVWNLGLRHILLSLWELIDSFLFENIQYMNYF